MTPNENFSSRERDEQADGIFSEYLVQQGAGHSPDFEALCRANPGQVDELRRIREQWIRFQPFAARLRSELNIDADLPTSIDPDVDESADQGSTTETRAQEAASRERYIERGEIARGGMGTILKVWDQDLHRPLAKKVVKLEHGSRKAGDEDSTVLLRFLEEAQITGQLSHPGVVPVHELGIDSAGRVYFTMRLIKGRDLRTIFEWVAEGRDGWSLARALDVLLRVCETMAFAHSKGVIHRDLKPANVMVGKFGEVYVMDWGVAKVVGRPDHRDLRLRPAPSTSISQVHTDRERDASDSPDSPLITQDGHVIGTPAYMPPEQARGLVAEVGVQSDVYAVGAMLYHLLTGEMPYVPRGAKVGAHAVWRWVLDGPPKSVDTLNPRAAPELVAICETAMARDPAHRYADMLALGEDLRAFQEQRVVRAYQTGAYAELRKWMVRNKAEAMAGVATVLTTILGTIVFIQVRAIDEVHSALAKARASELVALEEKAAVLRLSDVGRLSVLQRRADELWPATPERVQVLETWVQDARDLIENLANHRKALDGLRTQATPDAGAMTTPMVQGRPEWRFANAGTQWHHDTLAELVERMSAFAAPDPKEGRLVDVQSRLEFARAVHARTIDEYRDEWESTIASIRDRGQCPQYDGLVIVPQLGLVPLGRDPQSGLFEFAHLQTGSVPRRGTDGTLAITAESGLVFVLLPGGTFRMGAVKPSEDQKSGPNVDPQAQADEGPVHAVTLASFFMSKYEMTQGQWLRFMHENPSHYKPGTPAGEHAITLANPVEFVDWNQCKLALDRLGLMLPTEAQWEYAARAGTTSVRWTGDEREALRGAANIADQSAKRAGMDLPTIKDWPDLDDGYPVHAPVDAFRPNPFGLHNVLGNVWEWCRDGHEKTYTAKNQEGDGEALVQGAVFRMFRGGSSNLSAEWVRSARRMMSAPAARYDWLGVRPARTLTR